jgi:hypothetical protein
LSRPFDELPAEQKVAISDSFTRIRKCYGWTRVRGADFHALNDVITVNEYAEAKGEGSASFIYSDQEYFALVYEYIPSAKLELDAVQRQLDFFYHIGFHPCQDAMGRNWQGPGILLDFGDYNSPVDQWYEGRGACDLCLSAEVLVDRKRVEERLCKEWDKKAELRQRGIKPTEEEVLAEKKRQASRKTAICVEWGYQANPWYTPYFDRKFKHTMFLYTT